MKFRYWLLLLIIILIAGVVYFYDPLREQLVDYVSKKVTELNEKELREVNDGTKLVSNRYIDENWISTVVPEKLISTGYDLKMKLRKKLDSVTVVWRHPATGQTDTHVLEKFKPGDPEATYRIRDDFRNVLGGGNEYEIVGRLMKEEDPNDPSAIGGSTSGGNEPNDPKDSGQLNDELEELKVSFALDFNFKDCTEIRPELITLENLPDSTDGNELELRGSLKFGAKSVQVHSFNNDLGKATFAVLNKYEPGTKEFKYNLSEKLENLSPGNNEYLLMVYDETDELIIMKYFELKSNKKSVPAQVKDLFGEFNPIEGGWFVSTELPWFSYREVYEAVNYKKDDSNVILPRPTLMYTTNAEPGVELCDYLGAIDFEEEGMIYRGYSYETCQKYRYGVAVYDRFLSVLEHEPVKTVLKTDYNALKDKVSSALVMIEITDDTDKDDTDKEGTEKGSYIFQMLITEGKDYVDDVVVDIESEADAERQAQIEKIKDLLMNHSGEEVFGGG